MAVLVAVACIDQILNQFFTGLRFDFLRGFYAYDIYIIFLIAYFAFLTHGSITTNGKKLPSSIHQIIPFLFISILLLVFQYDSIDIGVLRSWVMIVPPAILIPIIQTIFSQVPKINLLNIATTWIVLTNLSNLCAGIFWLQIGNSLIRVEEKHVSSNDFTDAFYQTTGLYALLLFFWGMARFRNGWRLYQAYAAGIFSVCLIIITFNRASWFAFCVAFLFSPIFFPIKKLFHAAAQIILSILILISALYAFEFSGKTNIISEIERKILVAYEGQDNSANLRFDMIQYAIDLLLSNVILGGGYQASGSYISAEGINKVIHNSFLQVGVCGGIVFILSFLWIFLVPIVKAISSKQIYTNEYVGSLTCVLVATLAWMNFWPIAPAIWILCGFFGAIVSTAQMSSNTLGGIPVNALK